MKSSGGTFDVAVVGGGSAGIAASVSSARAGARTILIDRYGYLGGMGTASLVHTFCGLYLLRDEPGAVIANPGFAEEIATLMSQATGNGPVRMGRVDVLPQHPVEFVRIADLLVSQEPLISLKLHSELTGIVKNEAWQISIAGRNGGETFSAKNLIDASGDAAVAPMLNLNFRGTEAPRLQRPAYVFGIFRAGGELTAEQRLATAGLLAGGIRAAEIPAETVGLTFRSSGRAAEIFGTLDLSGGAESYDPLDTDCLVQLELTGRRIAAIAVAWLADRSEIWRGAYVSQWPIRAGVRESRHWVGKYVLTGNDLLEGRRFPDEIGLATWPMEMRENTRGPKLRFPTDNRPAGIPIRCLQPKGTDNLFMAGRCISTDHDAQASIRVMGTCFATGEAVGKAAALLADRLR